jgi:hypothetical protein
MSHLKPRFIGCVFILAQAASKPSAKKAIFRLLLTQFALIGCFGHHFTDIKASDTDATF